MYFNKKHDSFIKKRDQKNHTPASDEPLRVLALNCAKVRSRSLIDASVKMTGDLWSDGDVQVDGHLCGNINCAQLIIGADAAVTGAIIAHEAVIRGKFTGIIRATRVLLQDTASVDSEIIYRSLSVDEGVRFEGVAHRRPNPLQEEIAVSAVAEWRQKVAAADGTPANGAAASEPQAALPASASLEPVRQVERSGAGSS
jgi:cytoskeletal protein CcmA (bactofilin family)